MSARRLARYGLALFFFAAGILHFVADDQLARIVPPPVPAKLAVVWITGGIELLFAAALLVPRWRQVSGRLLALYLVAVLPANIHMALEDIPVAGTSLGATVLWVRVALQFPLIALVLWATRPERPA